MQGYLRSQGLTVTSVAGGRQWVQARGSVAQMDLAFGTTLTRYAYAGQQLRAPSSEVTVPASVRSDITGRGTPNGRAFLTGEDN